MKKDSGSSFDSAELRRRAEAQIKQDTAQTPWPPGAVGALRLVHELQVHQVELELQNHALQEIRDQLEKNLERYTNLYDFMPVGYATLASSGIIREINQAGATLFGTERACLIGRRFGLFVSKDTRPTFNTFLDQVRVSATQQRCEVVLTFESAPPRSVQLEGIGLTTDADRRCYMALLDITARKRAEQALRASEEKYRTVADFTHDWEYWSDPTGQYLYVSPSCERITGYPPEAFFADPGLMLAITHPEDRPYIVQHCICDAKTSMGALNFRIITREGQERWIGHVCQPVHSPDGRFLGRRGSNRDITQHKRAEDNLQRSEAQYRAVIETSADGFLMFDEQGHLQEVNEAYTRLSGYSRAELLSMHLSELEASENAGEMIAHLDKVRREGSDLFETQHRAKSGRVWQVGVNVCYWSAVGDRFFAFIRDLCHRQRSEMLLKIRMRLSQIAMTGTLDDLIQAALDDAERLTSSTIGFFHFIELDQEHLTLQTWSSHTLAICQANGQEQHYPVSQAGVWVECLRQRRPVIHNDYVNLPNRRGLPTGHVSLLRELTLPILVDGRVSAIIGVGNKPEDYTDDDVEFMQQLTDLMMDMVERKRTQNRVEHLAYHDALTRLPNRALLADRLQQAVAQARRDRKRLAVCYLDLDNFKPINDIHGHEKGDQVLIEVARRLNESVRAGDTVARLGGDEFVLLLGDLTDIEECEHAIDRVLTALQVPFIVASQSTMLSASIGVTLYPDDSADPGILLRHVDQAMYAAKQAGGHRYRWFNTDCERRARDYRETLQQVRDGLAAGEFCLYYQPKVDMRRGVVFGTEALIRWQHPDEGLLPPIRFIPAIQMSALAITLDQWVLNEALRQVVAWKRQGLDLWVSVNLSNRYLQQPDLVAQLQALLAAHPAAPAHRLLLEILEMTTLKDIKTVSTMIADCRQLGVHFALDDFGAGYSSLACLKNLPIDFLKIDQSFVRDMLADASALAIVKGVIGLAETFQLGVIAEGVETLAQGRRLINLGCNLAQGYGIARPMSPEQIPDWIAGWTLPEEWAQMGDGV